ncbi:MAG: C39 family peptidase [bacterium]|nr:C39 family peptidase [bacterium]
MFGTWTVRLLLVGTVVVAGWLGFVQREAHIATTPASESPPVPLVVETKGNSAVPALTPPASEESTAADTPLEEARGVVARGVVRLDVPFVSQAPYRVWSLPYKEFCEEASVLTLHLFASGERVDTASELDAALMDIKQWEEEHLGTWEDTTVAETARILREKFGHENTREVRFVTIADIMAAIDAGKPVIVPARGRELDSPYFTPPGPLYHMLVIIGYDDARQEFITNDVGTNTKGAGQRYTYDDLYGAIADWMHEDGAPTGGKAMIVLD